MLLVSLACPVTVFADDGAPPPTATEEEGKAEATVTEVPVVQEPAVTEEPVAEATQFPAMTQESVAPQVLVEADHLLPLDESEIIAAGEAMTIGEVLDATSDGTQVVVLDENGEALPLVSEEAADIVAGSDPMWCPEGETPLNDTNPLFSCHNFDAPAALIADMNLNSGNYTADGVIYFTPNPGGPFVLTTLADWAILSQQNLTLQGGWNGNSGTGFALIPGGLTTFSSSQVQIGTSGNPWAGKVTINDVMIENVAGTGLTVYTEGDIHLDQVISNHNGDTGAQLETDGNVMIQDSSFAKNIEDGLEVQAGNDVTLANVIASDNYDNGVEINSNGTVTLSHVTASDNEWTGVYTTAAEIRLVDVSANSNGGYGLMALIYNNESLQMPLSQNTEYGSITISNSRFNGNGKDAGRDGAYILSGGDVTIVCSQFNGNGNYGVGVYSVDGTLTLNEVTFTGNRKEEYFYQGEPVITSGGCRVVVATVIDTTPQPVHDLPPQPIHNLSPHVVPVGGGEEIKLDCENYSGTKLILSNGDQVTLPCPIKDYGMLTTKTVEQLPAPLDAAFAFASAMDVQVLRDGQSVDETQVGMTVDFLIPDGMQDASFAILRWDEEGAQWVDVSGSRTGDGHFLAINNFTGLYVLVTK
jgi:hypothetical protein